MHKYELFKMGDTENISEMFTRFADILNNLKALGRGTPNIEFVNNIICLLPRSWEPKVTSILKAKDLTKLKLEQLIRSLVTHVMITSIDVRKRRKTPQLKSPHPKMKLTMKKMRKLLSITQIQTTPH